jgi:hypothetical protein
VQLCREVPVLKPCEIISTTKKNIKKKPGKLNQRLNSSKKKEEEKVEKK